VSERRPEGRDDAGDGAGAAPGPAPAGATVEPTSIVEAGVVEAGGAPEAAEGAAGDRTAPAGAPRRRRGGAVWLLIVLLLGVAAGAAGAGWWGWRELEEQRAALERLRAGRGDTGKRLDALERRLDALGSQLERTETALRTSLDERVGTLRGRVRKLAESTRYLYEEAGRGRAGWSLAEVEYLLLIASHRLRLERDVEAAIAALESADDRLAAIDDPRHLPLRGRIAADLSALRALPKVDVPGIAARLGELVASVQDWPVAGTEPGDLAALGEPRDPGPDWQGVLGAIWQDVRRLVVVRRLDGAAAPFVGPEEKDYRRENVRIALHGARLAALRRDPRSYRASLDAVLERVRRDFDVQAAPVAAAVDALERLRAAALAPETPDLTDTLALVRSLADTAPAARGAAPEADAGGSGAGGGGGG